MGDKQFTYGVFTKPWPKKNLDELGEFISGLGFDGIEYPLRPGYPVTPDNIEDLPKAVKTLAKYNVKIDSIAGPTDERTIEACAAAGIPIIRICCGGGPDGYVAAEKALIKGFEKLVPALDKHGVAIGVQNHCGANLANAPGMIHVLEKFDPKHICAVWDAGHAGIEGQHPSVEIDIIYPYLKMVNLKNPFWYRTNHPEAPYSEWGIHWTTGRHGQGNWPAVAEELKKRGWSGPLCLTAEYSDHDRVDELITEDISFAKELFDGGCGCCKSCG